MSVNVACRYMLCFETMGDEVDDHRAMTSLPHKGADHPQSRLPHGMRRALDAAEVFACSAFSDG
jgi:hypothetical protein